MAGNRVPYTSGSFSVRAGEEEAFIAAVQEVAEWTMVNYSAAREVTLLRDPSRPGRFITIIRWDDEESIESWRADAEFGPYMTQLRDHCDSVEVFTLRRVCHFSRD